MREILEREGRPYGLQWIESLPRSQPASAAGCPGRASGWRRGMRWRCRCRCKFPAINSSEGHPGQLERALALDVHRAPAHSCSEKTNGLDGGRAASASQALCKLTSLGATTICFSKECEPSSRNYGHPVRGLHDRVGHPGRLRPRPGYHLPAVAHCRRSRTFRCRRFTNWPSSLAPQQNT